jgi:3-oxo-5-alpha-steroid 4-dehydrogenase 3
MGICPTPSPFFPGNVLSLTHTHTHRWFTHFYIWGSMWIVSITLVYFNTCILQKLKSIPIIDDIITLVTGGFLHHQCQSAPSQQQHVDTAVVLSMLSVQVVRRLYECLFVSVFSDSRIHLVHYVLGMFFYPAVALTALLHVDHRGDGCSLGHLQCTSYFLPLNT